MKLVTFCWVDHKTEKYQNHIESTKGRESYLEMERTWVGILIRMAGRGIYWTAMQRNVTQLMHSGKWRVLPPWYTKVNVLGYDDKLNTNLNTSLKKKYFYLDKLCFSR